MAISRYESSVASLGNDAVYGTGADGAVIISADTTLTTDMNYKNLTINSGVILKTNGFRVFVQGTLTLNGYIGHGTGAGAEPTSSVSTGTVAGTSNPTTLTYSVGGTGGGSTLNTATQLPVSYRQHINSLISGKVIKNDGTIETISGGSGGSSGSNGATGTAYTAPDSWPGKAGATGSSGGAGAAGANGGYPPNAATVGAGGGKGGTGGSGTAGASGSPGTVTNHTSGPGGAGGSGGVGGGIVLLAAKTITGTGKVISRGISGTAGSAGSAGASGTPGTAGANGATGTPGATAPSIAVITSHSPVNTYHAHNNGPHTPNHTNTAHVGRNFHSHSTGGSGKSADHTGHYHGSHQGHNSHQWHSGNFHHGYPHIAYIDTTHHDSAGYAHNHYTYSTANIHHQSPSYRRYEPYVHNTSSANTARWHHSPNHHTLTHTPNHTHYTGGAGGAGGASGAGGAGGAGAPAVTGSAGKRGGAGGGGGIIVITDTTPSGISYDTLAGQTADSDNYSASSGYTYIVLNA
jgi:hypothetical protein